MRISKVKTTAAIIITLIICVLLIPGCNENGDDGIAGSRNKMFRALVTDAIGTSVYVRNYTANESGYFDDYYFENKSDSIINAGDMIIIKYSKVNGQKLTVTWWQQDTSDESYVATETWIEDEEATNLSPADALNNTKLEITEIYNDCFFAKLTYNNSEYTIKVNTMLSKQFFAGDVVKADLSDVTVSMGTRRMEGEAVKVSFDSSANA